MKTTYVLSGLLVLSMLCFSGTAEAHRVSIFGWSEGDTVFTESKYSGGRKPKNVPVEVYDNDGNKLLEGRTDNNGKFSFKLTRKTGIKIVLQAGMGHRAEWSIPLEELDENISGGTGLAEKPQGGKPPVSQEISPPEPDHQDIEAAVEKILDEKLKPLHGKLNKLVEKRQKPSLTEVLGGLGYIIGLVGIAAYFRARRKED